MTFYIRNTYSEDPLINEPIDYVQSNVSFQKYLPELLFQWSTIGNGCD